MNRKLLILTALAAFIGSLSTSAQLLLGWDDFSNPDSGAIAATSTATGFTGSLLTNDPVWGQTTTGGLAGDTFGTLPGATGVGTSHLSLNNGAVGFVEFTVTNTSGTDYDLDFFHFDAGTTRPGAADAWTLSVVSGALTTGDVTSGVSPNGASATAVWTDYDLNLSGLADNTLEDTQSVVFRLTFALDSTQGPSGHHQYTDNIAVSGTAVPEPSTYVLLGGLFAFSFVAIRRRK